MGIHFAPDGIQIQVIDEKEFDRPEPGGGGRANARDGVFLLGKHHPEVGGICERHVILAGNSIWFRATLPNLWI